MFFIAMYFTGFAYKHLNNRQVGVRIDVAANATRNRV